MRDYGQLSHRLKCAAMYHFCRDIPFEYITITKTQKEMLMRVKYTYPLYKKHPEIEIYPILLELHQYRISGGFDRRKHWAQAFAKFEEQLLYYVADIVEKYRINLKDVVR